MFEFTPPSNAKVEEIVLPKKDAASADSSTPSGEHPHVTTHGQGITSVAVLESKSKEGAKQSPPTTEEGLQKVKINGIEASELPTALGTLLSFERSGVRYLLAGAVTPRGSRSGRQGPVVVNPADDGAQPERGVSRQAMSDEAPPVRARGWSSATRRSSRSTTST